MIWTLGNGESRKHIDIDKLKGIKVGCNAIHRDCKIDHLVCVDKRMVKEAVNNPRMKNSLIYTRKDWWVSYRLEPNLRTVPDLPYTGNKRWDEPFQWGSGPYAVLLAAILSQDTVGMIGFDLYSQTALINNLYKDTENYDPADKRAVDPRYWIHQISKVFDCFPNKSFMVFQTEGWELPETWKKSNVRLDKISSLV